jgi:hypothetical protein
VDNAVRDCDRVQVDSGLPPKQHLSLFPPASYDGPPANVIDRDVSKMTSESITQNPQNGIRQLASIGFEREDWTAFRSVEGLQRRAGTSRDKLAAVVVKELVDNALDGGGTATLIIVGAEDGDTIVVTDNGPGIEGDDERIARIFSMNRPQISSKYLRLPTRGALGNGIRVVVGAVAAAKGRLFVSTRGRTLEIIPDVAKGDSRAIRIGDAVSTGTRIEVVLGGALAPGKKDLWMGEYAIRAARGREVAYTGRTSPHWYDVESFHELAMSVADSSITAREFMTHFEGCSRLKIPRAYAGAPVRSLSRGDAADLLDTAKGVARMVDPARLGRTRADAFPGEYVKKAAVRREQYDGESKDVHIPFAVEVWASASLGAKSTIVFMVNWTPCITDAGAWHQGGNNGTRVAGGGLDFVIKTRKARMSAVVNIITPRMPLTTDGKAPALGAFGGTIENAMAAAWKRAKESRTQPEKISVKATVFQHMEEHIVAVSSNRKYRFNWRQVYYRIRPIVQDEKGSTLEWNYFSQTIVKEYLQEQGDEPMAYRDSRGTFHSPHGKGSFPLGTLGVEEYVRPGYLYNKVLVVEKEGFFEALKADGWPERHDCALMTSKGQPTDAARDLIDVIGESSEPVTVYLLHDCDAAGTIIYQSFQDATEFKKARSVSIVNLGMDVEEAIDLQEAGEIEIEDVPETDRTVARYVSEGHAEWLRTHRVELNVFTTERFIEWLDEKMEPYEGKLIPPVNHMADHLRDSLSLRVREQITAQILAEAGIDDQVKDALAGLAGKLDEVITTLPRVVADSLASDLQQRWSDPIDAMADVMAVAGDDRGAA